MNLIYSAMKKSAPLKEDLPIEVQTLKNSALVFRALNHRLRQNMLHLIHSNGEMTVTQIYVAMRMEQSVASQHLGILRNAGLVNTARNGKQILYSVNHTRLQQVHKIAADILQSSKD